MDEHNYLNQFWMNGMDEYLHIYIWKLLDVHHKYNVITEHVDSENITMGCCN